jgi:preprotein translocase subunit SecY
VAMLTGIPSGLALGGTGIIIIVTATVELWNSIKSNATTSGYNVSRVKIESKIYEAKDETEGGDTSYRLW